ncbi:MAG: phosphoglycerate dehydrogenase [Fimbriimonadaceae bacterium]|nr:phosphoglycerate dehydrogenase [Fimbriimonadaceae bacterium]
MKVLVTEAISEQGLEILRQAAPVDVQLGLNGAELAAAIDDYSVLVVRSATKVTEEVIAAAKRLKIIGRCGVGVDNIDVAAATRHGVLVLNSPFGNTDAAAEHTVSLLFALARNIAAAAQSVAEGRWERGKFVGVELHDKVLGVVGFGKIGSGVARRAQGLAMRVLVFDPLLNVERARLMNVESVELDDLLRRCDFLTFHCPLNRHTHHLLNAERLKLLKPTARIVNCARGGVIDEAALADALREGRVAGAAIDVFEHEPPFGEPRSPLLGAPNLIGTPHLGASTAEAQENVAIDVARQVLDAWRGEPVQGAVNLPALEAEEHRRLKPYLHLAEQLGVLQAHLARGRLERVEVSYLGALHDAPAAPLTRAVLRGLLRTFHGDSTINYVNVPSVVEDSGIQVSETRSMESATYHSVLRVGVRAGGHQHVADGSCFGSDPRIVALDGYGYNILPEGHLLVWYNTDQPGVIGKVGTLLGDAGVNIAGMQLGRDAFGGRAVSIVVIDAPIDQALIDRIRAIPGMLDVRVVDFGNGGASVGSRLVLPPSMGETA